MVFGRRPALAVLMTLPLRLPAQAVNPAAQARGAGAAARQSGHPVSTVKDTEGIAALSAQLSGGDATVRRNVLAALRQIVARASRPGAEAERKAVAAALLFQAQAGANHPVAARRTLLETAASVTQEENIPALVGLLADPDVREATQTALARTPSRGMERALVATLIQTRPAEVV